MSALDPVLVDHAMRLAEAEWRDAMAAGLGLAPAVIVAAPSRAWFVVQTTAHGEDKAREALGELGYETFAPTLRKEVWNKQKKVRSVRTFPLFSRYLFAELPARTELWAGVRAIEEVDRVLGQNGGLPVPRAEVERFIAAEAAGAFDEAKRAEEARSRSLRLQKSRGRRAEALIRYPVGSGVRALRGPFEGFSGHVTDITGRGVVKAMIRLFGGLTPVEFFPDDIEPVDERAATRIASRARTRRPSA